MKRPVEAMKDVKNKKILIRDNYRSIPLFSEIGINVTGLCNRRCDFCPRINENMFFPVKLFHRIVEQLENIGYNGLIMFSGMGEPLLHTELTEFIRLCKFRSAPIVEVITNGDLLNEDKLNALEEAGLDKLLISVYDGPEQLDYFKRLTSSTKIDVILRERWKHKNRIFNNRGGAIAPLQVPLIQSCFYPFYSLEVDYTGYCFPCCNDWQRQGSVGDSKCTSLMDIWLGSRMTKLRNELAKKQRISSDCDVCDAKGTLIGRNHFQGWLKYYAKESLLS